MLWKSPVFRTLTRPPMCIGLPIGYLNISLMITLSFFVLSGILQCLLFFIPFYLFGWISCKKDSAIFQILAKRMSCMPGANKRLWQCQSYDAR